MPLSCLDINGERVQAFDLADHEWAKLKERNRRERHLSMPCCGAKVVLKKSRRETRFFSHMRIGKCTTAEESEEHRYLKRLAVKAARSNGWVARTEVAGHSPEGSEWQADMLATKGKASVAIEVQWSSQTDDETLRRQRQYQSSGVRALWLFRQPGFPLSQEIPAACIGGDLKDGFVALLPHSYQRMTRQDRAIPSRWRQSMPLENFLAAVFAGRLKWGVPIEVFGDKANVEIGVAEADCEDCGVITDIITSIVVANSGISLDFGLLEIGEHQDLAHEVLSHLPKSFDQDHIKVRYSRSLGRRYLSNGCSGCGKLRGDYYMADYRNDERVIASFPIHLTGKWRRLAEHHIEVEEAEPEWWVVPEASAPGLT